MGVRDGQALELALAVLFLWRGWVVQGVELAGMPVLYEVRRGEANLPELADCIPCSTEAMTPLGTLRAIFKLAHPFTPHRSTLKAVRYPPLHEPSSNHPQISYERPRNSLYPAPRRAPLAPKSSNLQLSTSLNIKVTTLSLANGNQTSARKKRSLCSDRGWQ